MSYNRGVQRTINLAPACGTGKTVHSATSGNVAHMGGGFSLIVMKNKPQMSSDDFSTYLHAIVDGMTAGEILQHGNVYTELAEILNNEVIEAWERDHPVVLTSIDDQLKACLPDWTKLVASLIPDICDDYRASDDPDDETPAMCLTIGFTPETEDKDYSWSYQTGDNSYSGGAYSHPHWAVVTIARDSVPSEVAEEIADQIGELVSQ
jgi:hypothetical protein